jgi:broad specificity phosphatase PhoE
MTSARWPSRLWIVRHGESAGNVARDAAHAAGAERIELSHRDVDIPLSPLGEDQAGIDERLREKEFGILDGLTTSGVASVYPDQAEFRRILGKFYHRPPGGESWCDVIFRLRSLMDTIALHYAGRRVMIVAHQVVVLCLRYVIENLTEEEILAIDHQGDVANCSVTEYRFDPEGPQGGALKLVRYNDVVDHEGSAPVTAEPDRTTGVRG